ncbi:mannitol dehydrogenase family protein [Treponema zioleckii]|uniref:mannitol dehydrogenase family protein n=1 Tax=Treponema zioleckii TaxID=331680 RepID=UPI00168ABE71|nr:mannitol dehydrogenase family protein [Treponema zioleckii]
MKLTIEGLKDKDGWAKAGVKIPSYDIAAMQERTKKEPIWAHFGAGNIFRIFIGGLQDTLIANGESDKGICCVETFGFDIIDEMYVPHDNLVLGVTLKPDGNVDKRVIGSLAEAIKSIPGNTAEWARMKEIFASPSLQMVSFTITEKGYALYGSDGSYLPMAKADIEAGAAAPKTAMGQVASLLYHRFQNGAKPIAVVSMDNCSHNGEKLRSSITTIAREWQKKGFVSAEYCAWLEDEEKVSFPWSMIDKITPRPSEEIGKRLEADGIEAMQPVITKNKTYIAPFVNAEGPQYLVIEDRFPNGRPPLEKAGVYLTDRDTVNNVERMKVTTCLNPLHTSLAVYGCLLGYNLIADEMRDADLSALVHKVGPVEGMPVVTDPKILSPKDFVNEVINVRLPNPFMPDTPQRIACDTSQKVGIRFGETIKSYVARDGNAKKLKAIPLAIAGWCRYLLALDDNGKAFELSPDPMIPELTAHLKGIELGKPESYKGQLKPILANERIFGIDLYKAGIGELIENLFVEEISGTGAVRKTLHKYMAE